MLEPNWIKEFQDLILNSFDYKEDIVILKNLFDSLDAEISTTGEENEPYAEEDLVKAYELILLEYLVPSHYKVFRELTEAMRLEAGYDETFAR